MYKYSGTDKIGTHYTNATELSKFLDRLIRQINGQKILGLFSVGACFAFGLPPKHFFKTDMPFILVFENFEIVISYFVTSDAWIQVSPRQSGIAEYESEYPPDVNIATGWGELSLPVLGKHIHEISINRFQHSFSLDVHMHCAPENGDYFSVLRFHLDKDEILCFSGEVGESDGYMDVWLEYGDDPILDHPPSIIL